MQNYDYIILGGGISGVAFGRLLQMHTDKKFIILEKEDTAGGLCRTVVKEGNHLDIAGPQLLYSKHQEVYDFIFSHLPECEFNKSQRIARVHLMGRLIDYPIEQHLWQLSETMQYALLDSLIDAIQGPPAYINDFKGWIYKKMGRQLAENFFIPYHQKIWGRHLSDLSMEWQHNIPGVDIKAALKSVIYKKHDPEAVSICPHFYYPKQGGFQRVFDAIAAPVKGCIHLAEPVQGMTRMMNKWYVNGRYTAPVVISTIPWGLLPPIDDHNSGNHPLIDTLKHVSITTCFRKAEEGDSWFGEPHCVYIPDEDSPFYRMYNIDNVCCGNSDKVLCFEANTETAETITQRIPDPLYTNVNEYAYPVPLYTLKRDRPALLDFYESRKLYGLGVWGTWHHQNIDACILQAMELLSRLEGKVIQGIQDDAIIG